MRTLTNIAAASFLFAGPALGGPDERSEAWWAAVGPDGTQRINIRCGTNFVDPRHIVVRANVPVVLVVSTESNLRSHNFTFQIPAARAGLIDAPVGPTQRPFSFVPNLAGRYQIACRDTGPPSGAASARSKQGMLTVNP